MNFKTDQPMAQRLPFPLHVAKEGRGMFRVSLRTRIFKTPVRTPQDVVAPVLDFSHTRLSLDPVDATMHTCAWGLFAATYLIIANWIYCGYLDLWHGVYGIDDDEDDE
jgi:hypothetical protein